MSSGPSPVTRHSSLSSCRAFIDGEWLEISGVEKTPVYNPSRGEIIAEVPACTKEHVDLAVEAAAAAFPAWRDTPAVERARLFFRYRQLVEENFDRICQSVSREHGKTLAESRGSAYRGIENIEYACSVPTLLMGDTLENLARGVDCETMLQPLGVCVGITPFNFPAMVPMWMFPLALACGNTFILKPSEKVPLTALLIIELLEKAGLPKGVLNVVPRRTRISGRVADPSESESDLVRRVVASREIHLRNRNASRQTRPGKRRRKKLRRRHAGRRRAADGRSAFHRCIRLRGRTLHGGLNCHRGRQSGRARVADVG